MAGALAIIVALFHTAPDERQVVVTGAERAISTVHLIAAAALFLLLAVFCFFLFTKTDPTRPPTQRKRMRNTVYYVCGGVITAAVVLAFVSGFLSLPVQDAWKPLFWCETVAVIAFGVAWFIKGETLLKDVQPVAAPTGAEAVAASSSAP